MCKVEINKRPFNIGPIADKSITQPGQLIHSDIAGPEQSYNNKNYVINFVDEVSGLVDVKFMRNKSEVPAMIIEGLKDMKNIYRLSIGEDATFQSDGEQIYKSKKVEDTLAKLNLFQKFSPAYHPERNGTAERTYRTIFNDARAILLSSPLAETYYPLAIQHAVMVRNLLPKGKREKSAYEMLTKKDPNKIIARLHTFGSKAFVHNSKDDITKMMNKAFEGIYIGYDLLSESQKILNTATGKIILTVNVKIDDKINYKKITLNKKVVSKKENMTDKILEDVEEEIQPQHESISVPIEIFTPNLDIIPAAVLPEIENKDNESEIINVAREKDTSIPKKIG